MQTKIAFIILVVLGIILTITTNSFLIDESLIYGYFDNQLSLNQIKELLRIKNKWSWLPYALVPIIYLIKLTLVTFWVLCATIIFGYKKSFKEIFRAVLFAEFFWLIPSLVTILWFGFIATNYDLLDIQYFKPLALLNLFEISEIEAWLIFPLQSLNLFEIAYMFVLAVGIKRVLKKDYLGALNFTIPVYGSALVTWIAFITFLSINLTT